MIPFFDNKNQPSFQIGFFIEFWTKKYLLVTHSYFVKPYQNKSIFDFNLSKIVFLTYEVLFFSNRNTS